MEITMRTQSEIESRKREQLMELPIDQLLTVTREMREQANAKILEYCALAKKSINPLPEVTHNDSLSIEEQRSSLVEQYIENVNMKVQAEVAISTRISADAALNQYKAMKAQYASRRAPQSSGDIDEHSSSSRNTTRRS